MEKTNVEGKWCVYKHQSPTGKVYIGITSLRAERRWGHGCNYRHNKYFYSAIKKYGWESFTHEVLFENLDKQSAEQKEVELIALYKSSDKRFGYNLTSGGESGAHPSEETRKKTIRNSQGKKDGTLFRGKKKANLASKYGKEKAS